jgi:hypothetical protein
MRSCKISADRGEMSALHTVLRSVSISTRIVL